MHLPNMFSFLFSKYVFAVSISIANVYEIFKITIEPRAETQPILQFLLDTISEINTIGGWSRLLYFRSTKKYREVHESAFSPLEKF